MSLMKRRRIWAFLLSLLLFLPLGKAEQETPHVLRCFINHTWYPVDSFVGIIPDEITRQSGVSLSITVAQNERQLSQMIAQNTLPDMIFTSTQLNRLCNPELCYSYDELIERYGLQWDIPDTLRTNALIFSPDGQLYTLLNNYASNEEWQATSAVPIAPSLLVREDILHKMGVASIPTVDALRDVLLRVKDEYPDMIPLTFDTTHRFNVFRSFFGLGLLPFVEQADQTQRFYARDERYLAMLRYLNDLYLHGCLAVDNFVATVDGGGLLYAQGEAFAHTSCTQNGNLGMPNKLKAIDPSYRSVELYPTEGANYDTQGVGWSGVFITKNAKDPEACIRFVQWCYTQEAQRLTEWGREGIDYVMQEDGLPLFSEEVYRSISEGTYTETYNPWFYFGTSAIIEAEGRCALQGDALDKTTYDAIRTRYRIFPWITAALPGNTTELGLTYDHIRSVIDNYETKIILSENSAAFELNYQEMLSFLQAMGIDGLEEYMTRVVPQEYERYQRHLKGESYP